MFRGLARNPSVVHAVTTKNGPVFSKDAENTDGYTKLAEEMGFSSVAWTKQVHSNHIVPVDTGGFAGEGDGLVTRSRDLLLLSRSADCPLVLVADGAGRAVGIAHVSWRGLIAGAAGNLVKAMAERCSCRPEDLFGCVCPSAGPGRFEVGQEVYDAAVEAMGNAARYIFLDRDDTPETGKRQMNLWAGCSSQLMRAGIAFANIFTANVCTIENSDRFCSHRAEGESADRFVAVIGIK